MGVFDDYNEIGERIAQQIPGGAMADSDPLKSYEDLRAAGRRPYRRPVVSDRVSEAAKRRCDQREWFTHIRMGHIDDVKRMMHYKHVDINAQEDVGGQTGLMNALIWRQKEIVELLLKDPRIRVGCRSSFGKTELDLAQHYYPSMVGRLQKFMRSQQKANPQGRSGSRQKE